MNSDCIDLKGNNLTELTLELKYTWRRIMLFFPKHNTYLPDLK